MTTLLGIDIGGTGIKAALVDSSTGALVTDRHRILTPHPATPKAVSEVICEMAGHFDWTGPIGAAFPAVIRDGVAATATNIDEAWIGTNVAATFSKATGVSVTVLNDGDAAGVGEMAFGAGQGHRGVVLVLTLGTGIGSGLFTDGALVPNTELGHLMMHGKTAEQYASEGTREEESLSWEHWAERLQEYFDQLERLLWPELIIVGGGVSKKHDKFLPRLHTRAELVPAALGNQAGLVGAAITAARAATQA